MLTYNKRRSGAQHLRYAVPHGDVRGTARENGWSGQTVPTVEVRLLAVAHLFLAILGHDFTAPGKPT